MKQDRWKTIFLALMTIGILYLGIQNQGLKRQITMLSDQVNILNNNLVHVESGLRSEMNSHLNTIQQELQKEASLFSDTDISVSLSGKEILLQMKAIPKEIASDETLQFLVKTNDSDLVCEADENYDASLKIPRTPTIDVIALLRSDRGIRQESIEKLDTTGMFMIDLNSIWGGDSVNAESGHGFTVWLEPNWQLEKLPFDPEDVSKAEFVIHNSGIHELDANSAGDSHTWGQSIAAEAPMDPGSNLEDVRYVFEEDFGERINAVLIEGSTEERAGYYVELAKEREERKDGMRYEIYFCMTLKDGTRYATPSHAVATFALVENNSSESSGNGVMYPVF